MLLLALLELNQQLPSQSKQYLFSHFQNSNEPSPMLPLKPDPSSSFSSHNLQNQSSYPLKPSINQESLDVVNQLDFQMSKFKLSSQSQSNTQSQAMNYSQHNNIENTSAFSFGRTGGQSVDLSTPLKEEFKFRKSENSFQSEMTSIEGSTPYTHKRVSFADN